MKTIQLSERELSIVYSLMAPPYRAEDIRSDEFNELRNKVFYALRDAQNDEPVSNRDELPLGYLQGHKDGLEWAAQLAEANHPQTGDWLYDDPTELAKAIRKGPDMPFSDGNSPVIPDGWVACSERMPEENAEQQVLACFKGGDISTLYYFEGRWDDAYGIVPIRQDVTHWMPLPAAPQQEVKNV